MPRYVPLYVCVFFIQYDIFVSDNHDDNDYEDIDNNQHDDSDEGPPFKSSPSSSKKIPKEH